MRIVMFYHSLLSDWNHGNAHFLRGVASELLARGHDARVCEPLDSWSRNSLIEAHGLQPISEFHAVYPHLTGTVYDSDRLDLDTLLAGANVVIVHEWNEPDIVRRIGEHKAACADQYVLLFHDTHHRSATDPDAMERYDLRHYDGVLAFGNTVRDTYLRNRWTHRAWTWHEAADARMFRPLRSRRSTAAPLSGDLVWIGNWGDEERTAELHEFLIDPVRELGLSATLFGVRYPGHAVNALARAGITYGGWLPNYRVAETFAQFRLTVHVPRRPYAKSLPGIPTIRMFEALACGMPLISAPWADDEHLFVPGSDFLFARDGRDMKKHLKRVLHDRNLARNLGACGHRRILGRHTCRHRVDQLLAIIQELQATRFDGLQVSSRRSSHA
jgi:spore maturation protein CgeB